jgi:hypothetical protein
MLLSALLGGRVHAGEEGALVTRNYYYWSFEAGAAAGATGANPWHGGALGIWQGYYSNALSVEDGPEGNVPQGVKVLKLDKTRPEGSNGVSTVDAGVIAMASVPGNIVSAQVYINPDYLSEPRAMMDLNLRNLSASDGSAGEVYSSRTAAANQLAAGWNSLRYQVPAGKTDIWSKGRLSLNIRTLLNAAAVKALYPAMGEDEAAAYATQLKNDTGMEWYVDAIYIGPAAYEPEWGGEPAGFAADGLNQGPEEETAPPVLSGASAVRMDAASGAVVFTSDKAGTAYYGLGAEPADTDGAGSLAVAGTNILQVALPSRGAAEVHIVVKDGAGRLSSPGFTATIPAYDEEEPVGEDRLPYYFWSFEEGASPGSPGANPWKGEALGPWEGYYSTSLAAAGYAQTPAGAHGERALRLGKTRAESTAGVSIIDPGVLALARQPGSVVSASVYVDPGYVTEGSLLMQELNLRDWSSADSTAGERYALRGFGAGNTVAPGNEIRPGWNTLRYQVPEGETDAWPLGRITLNARTLSTAAVVRALYPAMTDGEIAGLTAQLSNDLSFVWYVDSIYIGPAAYEPAPSATPVNFREDGLNYTAPAAGEEPADLPGPAADPLLVHVSGSAPSNSAADGTLFNPYRTIGAAVKAARPGAGIIIGAGTYRETVRVKDGQTLQGASGVMPVISGLDTVSGWTWDAATGLYSADMDWSIDTTYQTNGTRVAGGGNQVFIDGAMAYEARWPNAGPTPPAQEGGLFQFRKSTFDTVTMNYSAKTAAIKDSDLGELAGINLAGATMWYISGQKWNSRPGTVLEHTYQSITISLNGGAANPAEQYYHPRPGNEYILYGLKAFLDSDEEWYWDRIERKLYMKADPAGKLIESKRREIAVDLSGTTGVTLKNVAIRGATIISDSGTSYAVIDGIRAEYVNHAANFDNGNVYDPANNGILLAGSHNILKNSEVAYAAGGLVTLQGSGSRLVNNYLHDADYTGGWVSAVNLAGTGHVASRNTITRAGRDIINLRQTKAGIIEYNDLSYAGELCEDLGTLYTYSADGAGTEIRYNKIHDSEIANGIYLDNNSMNFLVHHNVSYNLQARSGLKNNAFSTFNLFFNNTNYHEAPMNMIALADYPLSAYGTRYYNNILGNSYTTASDIAWSYNLQMTDVQAESIFRNPAQGDFRLKEGLTTWYGAYAGKPLPGINETGYIGAYEYDPATGEILNPFPAGHDFADPPQDVSYLLTNTPYRNAVADGTFERSTASDNYSLAAPWEVYGGGEARIKRDSAFYVRNDGFGVHLKGAGTGIRQMVTDLLPETDYMLTARIQSAPETGVAGSLNGGRARLGVVSGGTAYSAEAESAKQVVRANSGTPMPEWVLVSVPFRTGEDGRAEVFAQVVNIAANMDHIGVILPLAETDARAVLGEGITAAEHVLQSAAGMPAAISAAFRGLIDESRLVWNNPAATSAELENQTAALRLGQDAFVMKKQLLDALLSAEQLCAELVFDGGDYHYPPAAKPALEAVITAQSVVLHDTSASAADIAAAIAAVEAGKLELYDAIVMPSIALYDKADMAQILASGDNWSRKGLAGDYAVDGEGFMSFRSSTGEGANQWSKGATFYNQARFGDVMYEMDMDYTPAAADWPAFVIRAQVAQESIFGDNQNHYLAVFRTHNVELQKWINGSEDSSFRVVFPTGAIQPGLNRIQLGAVDVYRDGLFAGVRIFFYANGVKIYDFLDRTASGISGDGYFGVALYPPAMPLKLRAVP